MQHSQESLLDRVVSDREHARGRLDANRPRCLNVDHEGAGKPDAAHKARCPLAELIPRLLLILPALMLRRMEVSDIPF